MHGACVPQSIILPSTMSGPRWRPASHLPLSALRLTSGMRHMHASTEAVPEPCCSSLVVDGVGRAKAVCTFSGASGPLQGFEADSSTSVPWPSAAWAGPSLGWIRRACSDHPACSSNSFSATSLEAPRRQGTSEAGPSGPSLSPLNQHMATHLSARFFSDLHQAAPFTGRLPLLQPGHRGCSEQHLGAVLLIVVACPASPARQSRQRALAASPLHPIEPLARSPPSTPSKWGAQMAAGSAAAQLRRRP